MRPTTRRGGVVAAATAVATAALVAPAVPSAAQIGTVCTSWTSIDWSTSGEFNAIVTATVSGECKVPGWTTCDITLSGVPGVLGRMRTAGYNYCDSSITFVGLQNTPYVAVGTIGYSAAEAPVTGSTAYAVPHS
jgi:hypothetical protein